MRSDGRPLELWQEANFEKSPITKIFQSSNLMDEQLKPKVPKIPHIVSFLCQHKSIFLFMPILKLVLGEFRGLKSELKIQGSHHSFFNTG